MENKSKFIWMNGELVDYDKATAHILNPGKIFTPSTAPMLEGITRHSVYTTANDLGYELIEAPVARDQLYLADEIFACGTAAEMIGLCEIDFRTISDGKSGKVTAR